MAAMFENATDFEISGGEFTLHNNVQHSLSVYSTKKSAIDRLVEASSLGALHNSGERFDPPKCHPNTRTAVLKKLMDWFIGKAGWDIFVLWLYGPAGAGKSAIAQTFAEQCAMTNDLLASFFFSRSDPKRNNENALVATLAYQVSLRIPGCWEIVEPIIDRDPAIFQLNFETQFQTLILNPLLQLSTTGLFMSGESLPYLFIIDGLDECNGSNVQRTILSTISNALQQHCFTLPLMFIIASRPEHHLTVPFNDASLNNLTLRLALDDTYRPDKDIKLYLKDSFRSIRKTHIMRAHLPDSWPSKDDITKLVTKSSGQFIYAATVVRYVSSPRHNPRNRLKVIHGLLPVNNDKPYSQLDALYINILSGVEDIKATLRVLGLFQLVSGNGMDTVDQLERFMLLDPGNIQLLLLDLPSVVDASDDQKPIKFLHASFGDFLFDPTRSLQFYINPNKIHEEAARLCIAHINTFHSSDLIARPDEVLNIILDHVLEFFIHHLQNADPLHGNDTLRANILNMSYVQSLWAYTEHNSDHVASQTGGCLAEFLKFLRTSDFSNTKALYLHHRGVWDQIMHMDLSQVTHIRGLAFWTAWLVTSEDINHLNHIHSDTVLALPSSSPTSKDLLYAPPPFFIGKAHSYTMTFNGIRHPIIPSYIEDNLGLFFIDTDYSDFLKDFLTNPSRAGPYTVNESTYILAAEFVVEFAVRPWDQQKDLVLRYDGQWDLIWDAFVSVLSRAGNSDEVVSVLRRRDLTFVLGIPEENLRNRLRSMFRAVGDYLLRCTGSIPTGFKIIINWTQMYLPDMGIDDIEGFATDRVFYLDESINTQ